MKRWISVALMVAAVAAGVPAHAEPDPRLPALLAVHRQDLMSAAMVRYCQANAPQQASALKTAWQSWRQRQALDSVALRLQRTGPQALQGLSPAQLQQLQARMERAGPATQVCAALEAGWGSAGTDLRSHYPLAFAAEPRPVQPAVTFAAP